MITYQQYEKAIFDWLTAKNEKDRNFTFSTRLKANKGSELDYFIGTEKSGYFGFTFWEIPVSYPGSSADLIDFFFERKDGGFKYFVEFNHTLSPEGKQNESALALIKRIKNRTSNVGSIISESKGDRNLNFKIGAPQQIYSSLNELFIDLDKTINTLIPIVDECILEEKTHNLHFKADRIPALKFAVNQIELEGRIEKYSKINIQTLNDEEVYDPTSKLVLKKNILNHPPLNQILYGPPGTGKTFTLNKEYFSKYTSNESSLSVDQHFINVISECSWWQVIAIALMQEGKSKVSTLSENKWIKQKAALSNSNTVRPTLWSQLQSHTIEQCSFVNVKAKQQPFIFNKTEDSFWEILPEEVKENAPELLDLLESVENFTPRSDKKIERFVFTTFHQGYSYEDFIEGIKPVLEENDGQLHYQIEDGIFKRLCSKAESDPQNKYAIFIDEINRGNVSAIFGELITLIEADKRKGAANELTVILPYSKRSFSVPSNIDIYGTMNTADRSVEALDTALRRRFSFVEMLPDASKLENIQIEGVDLALLLNTLNERIEVLVDRDHTIGHAFFMNIESLSDLRSAFANKIVPLLQEYFYGNYRKMEMVIGSAFFNITEANKVKFAVKSDEFDADGTVYHIKNISHEDGMSDTVFIEALNQLIQGA